MRCRTRIGGASTTTAPASRATRAVPSREPLSATTTRRSQGAAGVAPFAEARSRARSPSTSGSEASSFKAGMTTSTTGGGTPGL